MSFNLQDASVWQKMPSLSPKSACYDVNGWRILLADGTLSPCFIDAVILVIPSLVLLLFGSFSVIQLSKAPNTYRLAEFQRPWVYYTTVALALVQVGLWTAIAAFAATTFGWDLRALTPTFTVVVSSLALHLHVLERQKLTVQSSVLLFYWPLTIAATMMKVFSLGSRDQYHASPAIALLYSLSGINTVLVFIFEYVIPKITFFQVMKGRDPLDTEHGMLEYADVYSRISLSWMNPLIMRATEASLTLDSLPSIDEEFNAFNSTRIFEKHWSARKSDSVWYLILVLVKAYGPSIGMSYMFEFAYDVSGFAQPFFVRYLIIFAESYLNNDKLTPPLPMSVGFYIALGMFFVNIVRTVFATNLFLYLLRTVANLRSALGASIYRKSLVLSNKERQGRSTGEIVNIMAVDLNTISNLLFSVTNLWESPIQFSICLFALHQIVGKSVWSALVVLIVFFPVNWYVSKVAKRMRKQQMAYKDERTRLTTEIFVNVKSLKLYGWETALLDRLHHVRNDLQLKNLRNLILFSCIMDFVWTVIPFFISCSTFAMFAYMEDVPLTPEIVFPCVALFDMMTAPLNDIPRMISMVVDSGVSFVRVRDFLISQELQHDAVTRLPAAETPGENSVEVKNASYLWDQDDTESAILKDIDFTVKTGELTCIVGKVGAGKTSFLKAILGDIHKSGGSVTVRGNIAYVAQDPWLVNASLKENIMFGHRYDPEFYQQTLQACALLPDLEILPDGDETEIGERGVSLSGGQKARVSLARAVYARADVYLMDDPLSAVDEHVRRHIVSNVLSTGGLLASKTVILATNAISILTKADNITLIKDKTICEQATFSQVVTKRSGLLFDLINEFGSQSDEDAEGSETHSLASSTPQLSRKTSSTTLRRASVASFGKKQGVALSKRTATKKETSQVGRVQWHVYRRYVRACGNIPLALSLLLIIFASLQTLAANFWLKAWAEANARLGENRDIPMWVGGYLFLGFIAAAIAILRKIVARISCGLRASKLLHDTMAHTVMRSPMSFFETTPVGRIINRFSSDVNELDEGLPAAFIDLVRTIVKLVVSLGVVVYGAPVVLAVMVPLSFLYYYYQFYYQSASRELKRLMSISRSPIFAHFQESLAGISTIRAFSQQDRFRYGNEATIDSNIHAVFLFRSANRWLSFRLQSIGAVIVFATACSVVVGSTKGAFSPGFIGIMMTYTSEVTDFLSWIVKAIVNMETSVVGVERVLEYCDLPNEAPEILEDSRPPVDWPNDGVVSFNDYSARYRPGLDLVLKNITLDIKPQEKIGVVGRTGAGKSSLVMALFRIIEPTGGAISIDGLDIASIGLLDLRSNLSIIPQDSQVFEGTMRQNLDPVGRHSDDELWRVLDLAHLKEHVQLMGGLESHVAEGGSNLSSGQRQLMCLGRALLHESSVLVLDEATASVDVQTDKVVQQTIRTEFASKTIVTIAHRLNTILDSDRIIVLEKGEVAEFDTPERLLANESSLFYALCKQGGFVDSSRASPEPAQ